MPKLYLLTIDEETPELLKGQFLKKPIREAGESGRRSGVRPRATDSPGGNRGVCGRAHQRRLSGRAYRERVGRLTSDLVKLCVLCSGLQA